MMRGLSITRVILSWFICFTPLTCLGLDPLAQALLKAEMKPEQVTFDRMDIKLYGGDVHALPYFEILFRDPLKVPKYTRTLVKRAGDKRDSLSALIGDLSRKAGSTVRRGLIKNPVSEYEAMLDQTDPLATALRHLLDVTGQVYSEEYVTHLLGQAESVPENLSKEIAVLVYTAAEAVKWKDKALMGVDPATTDRLLWKVRLNLSDETQSLDPGLRSLAGTIDYNYLYCGAQDLASAADRAVTKLQEIDFADDLSVRIDTPLGRIELSGSQQNRYDLPSGYLLIIDAGGNDTYITAASASPHTVPVSILIDMAGNDRYLSADEHGPSFGGAVLGYAFLVDLDGDDTYRGPYLSQGAGVLGAGCLLDVKGKDMYDSIGPAQGAGIFGLGCLVDLEGDDFYHCYSMAQGFGFTLGAGLLLDSDGNDRYVAEDKDIRFPSSQTDSHNSSLAQGCGFGLRADFTDGHSLAGGVGTLVDLGGDDVYSCGVFGQGAGYWYGVGILADNAGNDRYEGVWYTQAAAAHFAVGILYDNEGDDSYKAEINMAQGAGHDYSLGFFIDKAGHDKYKAPNLSLGGGNANGIGIFFDWRGNDIYDVKADVTLGRANTASRGSLRETFLTLGVFMDCGGQDNYSKKYARNNWRWQQPGVNREEPLETEVGVGIDGDYNRLPWQ
ncbi:hypothetical protein ACFLU6_09560 [Acidobacteriota bacterium]